MMESKNDNNNGSGGGLGGLGGLGGSSSTSSSTSSSSRSRSRSRSSSNDNNLINKNTNIILSNNIEESYRKNRRYNNTKKNNPGGGAGGPVPLIVGRIPNCNNFSNNDAEKILVNEMNNCTIKDRTAIQEEIHGVYCLALDYNETPELITSSLKQLSVELDNDEHIPQYEKHAYILSQRLQKEQDEEQQQQPNSSSIVLLYVNSIEFRLMYLRCELFDVKKAAKSIVQALDFLLKYYGEYALKRKIKLSDFTKNELNIMKKGLVQLLPSRELH
jgi:hypothetical protein